MMNKKDKLFQVVEGVIDIYVYLPLYQQDHISIYTKLHIDARL
jgi:hypothetical protein